MDIHVIVFPLVSLLPLLILFRVFPCTFSPQFPLQFLALHPAFRFLLHQRPRLLSLSELSTQRLIISLEHHKCQQSAVSVSRSQNPIFHPDLNPPQHAAYVGSQQTFA